MVLFGSFKYTVVPLMVLNGKQERLESACMLHVVQVWGWVGDV